MYCSIDVLNFIKRRLNYNLLPCEDCLNLLLYRHLWIPGLYAPSDLLSALLKTLHLLDALHSYALMHEDHNVLAADLVVLKYFPL